MNDSNRCEYRVQVDQLVLEAVTTVADGGAALTRPMTCELNLHLDGEDAGLKISLSRGQLIATLQFFQAIWVQIGGLGKMEPAEWKEVR